MKTLNISVLAAAGIVSAAIAFAQAPPAIQPVMMKQLKPDVWAGLGGSGGNSTIYISTVHWICSRSKSFTSFTSVRSRTSISSIHHI